MSSSLTSTSAVTRANSARARGSASAAAAMLPISSRAVMSGSSSSSLGALSASHRGRGFGGDHPFGHDQLGQPTPQLPALTGACRRQRRGAAGRRAVAPRARRLRRPAPDRRLRSRRSSARSPSPRASRPAGRRSRPGSAPTTGRVRPRPAGFTSKPTSTVPRAGSTAPSAAGPIHSHVPHGLIRCASRLRSAPASRADGGGQPGRITRGHNDIRRAPSRDRPARASSAPPTETSATSSTTWRQAAGTPASVTASCARTGYTPGSTPAGVFSTMSASRCSPGGNVKGSAAGPADQPCGQTSVTVPVSGASVLSLANGQAQRHLGVRGRR